jgi:transposase
LGRSRGGYGTKIHLVCTDEDTAVAVSLTPGQAGDAPEFEALFDAAAARVPDAEAAVGDKGYDSWAIKFKVLAAGMPAHIPSKSNAVEPWPHDEAAYKERNRVERLFNKLKQFRAVATRYDKLGAVFLSTVKLALAFIKVRAIVNRT